MNGFILCSLALSAQENVVLRDDYGIDSTLSDQFYIRIKNTNFFKNNEYANEFKIGSSITGLFLEPTIDYYAGERTRIRTGVHFLKYNGRDNIERAAPVLSVQHKLNENVDMVFGTLFGTVNHDLREPVFGFEKYLVDNYENGFQFLLSYPNVKGDIWLNWEQYIQEGDPFQEKFTAGASLLFNLYRSSGFTLSAPMQALFRHTGGQIDNSDLPAGTKSNFVQGIRAEWKMDNSFIRGLEMEQGWYQFLEVNPGNHIEVLDGYASYSTMRVETMAGEFSVGYWNSVNYTSPHGEILFHSYSDFLTDFYMPERKMLSIKYQYHYEINNFLDFVFRLEPYYHFHSGRLDHTLGVMLVVNKEFFLAKAISR